MSIRASIWSRAFPIGRFQFLFDLGRDLLVVVIMDLQTEGVGAARHRLADAAHADNTQLLAVQAVAQHPVGRPALEPVFFQRDHAFHQTARHRQDQRHGRRRRHPRSAPRACW